MSKTLLLSLIPLGIFAQVQNFPVAGSGGSGTPNQVIEQAGPVTTATFNFSPALASATGLVFQCFTGTGFSSGHVTGTLTPLPLTTVNPPTTSSATVNFSSSSNVICTVNDSGGQGAQGTAGNTVLSGSGAPSNGTGNNGDFYLRTDTTCLYGPKSGGAWPGGCTSLIGPQGPAGSGSGDVLQAGNNTYTGINNFLNARVILPAATFASPPSSPATGQIFKFSDATATGTCSGGGTAQATCYYTGAGWASIGGGGVGGGGGGLSDPGSNGPIKRTALNTTAPATMADIVALWTSCGGNYMRGDGTCTPGTGGLNDPGNAGLVKRTTLNTTTVATPGTDYYAPGTAVAQNDLPTNTVFNDAQNSFSDPGNQYFGKYDVVCDATSVSADNVLVKKNGAACAALTTSDTGMDSGLVGVLQSGHGTVNGKVRKMGVADICAFGTFAAGNWVVVSTHTAGCVEASAVRPTAPAVIIGIANATAGATVPVDVQIDPNEANGGGGSTTAVHSSAFTSGGTDTAGNCAGLTCFDIAGDNTAHVITWQNNREDVGSVHSTSVNPTRFTAPTTGWYEVKCQVQWNNSWSGLGNISVSVNGTTLVANAINTAMNFNVQRAAGYVHMSNGDYAECFARQNSGSAQPIIDGDGQTFMQLTLIGGAGNGDTSSNTSVSVDGEVALFSGTSGKLIKRATGTGLARLASGVQSAAELSGDVTTSGSNVTTIAANAVNSAKMAVVNTRRVCSIVIGADNATSALADADIGPQGRQCYVPAAATIVEITIAADAGTPSVLVRKNHGGTTTNLTGAAFATAASGGLACANASGSGNGIDGATTCATALTSTSLAAGDWIGTASGTAGGTAKRMSIAVTYTIN